MHALVRMLAAAAILGGTTMSATSAQVSLAANGRASCDILVAPDATEPEKYAARELADWLGKATGATFAVKPLVGTLPARAILVGPSREAKTVAPDVDFAKLGLEEVVIRTNGGRLLLAGGRPRGTLYAVYRFLGRQVGIRWWAPWATDVPNRRTLRVSALNIRETPAFESRDPFWYPAFNGDWAARNLSNSQNARLRPEHGGTIRYKGFVHTFYPLIPPEKYFATHPEWFSMNREGKRYVEGGQLCTTNPQLRDALVEAVRSWLRESPDARIVSISQNDWHGTCLCENCKAIDEAEGSHSGTMVALLNYIAAKLGPEFPHVAFDTLAYQYTRKAPKTLKPLPNVIIRLCSIECNFRQPLESPANKSFGDDLRDWSKICNRLYIWDYVTNFAHYVLPHPNWFALGPNVRFFHKHGVKGLFEQGAYQSHGGEMSELRAWVLAQLLWNPYQDDVKLIDEFLDGYYGKASGRLIRQYMDLLHEASRDVNLTCYSPPSAAFLSFKNLQKAEMLWREAEKAATDPDKLWRVKQGHNCVRYAWLANWSSLRRQCRQEGAQWPLGTAQEVAAEFLAIATGPGPAGWAPMTHINEGGLTPKAFTDRFVQAAEDKAPLPSDIPGATPQNAVGVQDIAASLYNQGTLCDRRPDPKASNGSALWMPGTHIEWAVQFPASSLPERLLDGTWNVYIVARVEKGPNTKSEGHALQAGVYDTGKREVMAQLGVPVETAGAEYRSYLIGKVTMNPEAYIWVNPVRETGIEAVWIDRLVFVKAD